MKFEIKSWWSGAILFSIETDSWKLAIEAAVKAKTDLSGAVLCNADLSNADLSGAVLSGAVLCGADLSGADLSGAVLCGAVLCGAVLSGADLSGAVLCGAVLSNAVLRNADLSGAVQYIKVPQLHAQILAAIESGGGFDMSSWHSCETTHCRAGWAITLAGPAGKVLEACMGPAAAGALITMASCPWMEKVPNFYATNEVALDDIKACAAKERELEDTASLVAQPQTEKSVQEQEAQ